MSLLGAIVVAAGKGTRMGAKESKQYIQLGGKPIIVHTLEALEQASNVSEVILVVGAQDIAMCEGLKSTYNLTKIQAIVAGGEERQSSVYEGLLRSSTEWIIVHDGVRPFVTEQLIERCWQAAERFGGSVAAVPVKDTIKVADQAGKVVATPDRATLWAVQTPQAFRRDQLLAAHEAARQDAFIGTDDASVAERYGIAVHLVTGDYNNIKITTPDDLHWAEYQLSRDQQTRS